MNQFPAAWNALSLRRRIIVGLATLGMFAAVLGMTRLSAQSEMALLYSGLDPVASGEVIQALDAQGALYWNGQPVSRELAAQRFVEAAAQRPQPELHLRADQNVAYRHVATTLADASRAGLTRLGFVSQPLPVSPPR